METFTRDGVSLRYRVDGTGFPVLLFAPGGMRSAAAFWKNAPWNPVTELRDRFRVIAMDQRNAGGSTAPVSADDGWSTYTSDHVALLDHLGVARCHVVGGCIGGSYGLGLIQAAPERVAAAVLQQPIGFDGANRQAFYDMFDGWAKALAPDHPHMSPSDWQRFRGNMYDGDFVFNVDRAFVSRCTTPLLVLMGSDLYHPEVTSRDIVSAAPRGELIEAWKQGDAVSTAVARVRAFLSEHADAPPI